MDRKSILTALEQHFGVRAKYMGAPSFAYQIEVIGNTYTIDREGKLLNSEGLMVELQTANFT